MPIAYIATGLLFFLSFCPPPSLLVIINFNDCMQRGSIPSASKGFCFYFLLFVVNTYGTHGTHGIHVILEPMVPMEVHFQC